MPSRQLSAALSPKGTDLFLFMFNCFSSGNLVSFVQIAVKDQVEAAGEKLLDSTCPDLVHAYSMMGDMAAAHQALETLPSNGRNASHIHKQTHTALLEWCVSTPSNACIICVAESHTQLAPNNCA